MASERDLKSLGLVLVFVRQHFSSLKEEFERMKRELWEWNSEAERQLKHLPVNYGILLRQASVLQGLQAVSPHFNHCLQSALEDARSRRPNDGLYVSLSA